MGAKTSSASCEYAVSTGKALVVAQRLQVAVEPAPRMLVDLLEKNRALQMEGRARLVWEMGDVVAVGMSVATCWNQ